jgi:hypothetical protein
MQPVIQWPPYVTLMGTELLVVHCGLLVNLIQRYVSVAGCFKDSIRKTMLVQNMALNILYGAYYRQLLDTNFKQFLSVCSPGVARVSELQVISNTCFNTQQVILCSYNKAC